MTQCKKWLSLILAALMLLSVITVFAGCGETAETPEMKETGTQAAGSEAETIEDVSPLEMDKLLGEK